MASSTSPETLAALPCSIQVYQETPTPASRATSSRRSPGVRRVPDVGSPTWAGVISVRWAFRKSPSSTGCGERGDVQRYFQPPTGWSISLHL